MKKIFGAVMAGSLALLLSACNSSEAQDKLTAEKLMAKSNEATETSLKSVHAHINFDDYAVTVYNGDIENPEKAGVVYDLQVDAYLDPEKVKHTATVAPRGIKKYEENLYNISGKNIVKKADDAEWQQVGTIEEQYGSFVNAVYPTLDLSKFEPFKDDFILEPIEYGYALKLTLDRNGFKEFKKVFPDAGPVNDGFRIVDKMELVITFNKSTSYVTSFKMSSDVRHFADGNSYRSRQKMNATYSYFNDIKDFAIPKEVQEIASK
ncbi:DUF6612 family protein [Sporosarcina contaminans]|uniref:DUF6612 family protein n=1 Tax=Sporosarcina contaminans TaxID=633403 RepID=A0ABW3TT54_9BACL